MIIATELVDMFKEDAMFANVEAVKGYLNFKLSEDFLNEYATWALDNPSDFAKGTGSSKILLELVSANPTGPLHIGHARCTQVDDRSNDIDRTHDGGYTHHVN